MTASQGGFERRVLGALDAAPSRIPVILGGCGTGRTWLVRRLCQPTERNGAPHAQYIDVERCATTPERFLEAVTTATPFGWRAPGKAPVTAREAFDALLEFFDSARTLDGGPCTFVLDEVLELRTFESFPGLRHVVRDLLGALSASANRFILTTRYVARAHRILRDAAPRFEVLHMPPMTAADVTSMLAPVFNGYEQMATDDRDYLGRVVQALTDGRAMYIKAIGDMLGQMQGAADPVSALTALLSRDGALDHSCRFSYELRLHRARGYGALKAILDILATQDDITLTEISVKLRRTPGSTKDYLSWLEDVDLVTSRQKRYSFTDPLLRLWVRLHCHPEPPGVEAVAREVRAYAEPRLPSREPVALAYAGIEATPEERKSWGIIEID